MPTLVTFGEIMLRLTPPGFQRLTQAVSLDMTFGGAEASVAVSLARFGDAARYVTRLPKNDIGEACLNRLRGLGVDVQHVARGGERMGIYFLETGASQRASTVTYDRAHSAIAEIDGNEIDWKKICAGAQWFHFTGITPALSDKAAAATEIALREAKAQGLTVSVDLNYRKKLWSTARAREVMTGLMKYVDVCIGNEEDAENVFGLKAHGTEVTAGKIDHERYIDVARQLTEKFKFKSVAITLRESHSASRNGWSGLFYTGGKGYFSRRYDIDIVDRLGGGDAFGGGLIHSLLHDKSPQETIEFAVAASCLKQTILGDFNLVSRQEVETLAGGDASGRVQR